MMGILNRVAPPPSLELFYIITQFLVPQQFRVPQPGSARFGRKIERNYLF